MDDKIVSLLNQLLEGQTRIENKLNSVVEQTADLTEFRTESISKLTDIGLNIENIKDDLSNVEVITASNWKDIAKLKAVK
jgi:regulator of replication initiation timing